MFDEFYLFLNCTVNLSPAPPMNEILHSEVGSIGGNHGGSLCKVGAMQGMVLLVRPGNLFNKHIIRISIAITFIQTIKRTIYKYKTLMCMF